MRLRLVHDVTLPPTRRRPPSPPTPDWSRHDHRPRLAPVNAAPYYADEHITLYHGDCREVTAWLEADVLVTDPPYGMAFRSNKRKGQRFAAIVGDVDTTVRDAALAAWGSERPALVFGRWSVTPPARERLRLIWSKEGSPGMGDLAMPWGPAHEDIHLLGSGWDRELAGVKREGSVIPTRGQRGGASGAENETGHPTPKPVRLMEYLIRRCPPRHHHGPVRGQRSHPSRRSECWPSRHRRRAGGTILRGHCPPPRSRRHRLRDPGCERHCDVRI